jgi:hypothetical protein
VSAKGGSTVTNNYSCQQYVRGYVDDNVLSLANSYRIKMWTQHYVNASLLILQSLSFLVNKIINYKKRLWTHWDTADDPRRTANFVQRHGLRIETVAAELRRGIKSRLLTKYIVAHGSGPNTVRVRKNYITLLFVTCSSKVLK